MKRILLFVGTIAATGLLAQPNLTFPFSDDLFPQSLTFHVGGLLEEGPSGANQIWDFSDVVLPVTQAASLDNPSNTPFASDYPNADLVGINNEEFIGTSYAFYSFETDGVYTIGFELDGTFSISQPYSDPRRDLSSPLSFGDSFADVSVFESTTLGLTSDGESDLSLEVDGYGTLITPEGTYGNVLRVRTNETTVVTFDIGIGQPSTTTTILESFAWFVDGYPIPIMIISNQSGDGNPGDATSRYISGVPLLTTEFNTLEGVSIYPVPSVDFVNLEMGDNTTNQAIVRIFDVKGSIVKEFNQRVEKVTRFDVSDLPSGFYSINIQTEEGMATKHFTK